MELCKNIYVYFFSFQFNVIIVDHQNQKNIIFDENI